MKQIIIKQQYLTAMLLDLSQISNISPFHFIISAENPINISLNQHYNTSSNYMRTTQQKQINLHSSSLLCNCFLIAKLQTYHQSFVKKKQNFNKKNLKIQFLGDFAVPIKRKAYERVRGRPGANRGSVWE